MYEKIAWYVSLFPSEMDFPEVDTSLITDIWFTNQESLDVGLFDMKNHAVLLCNFFNCLDSSNEINAVSYIVFGKSINEGYAAYVLRKNDRPDGDPDAQHIELWNPLTADCYCLNKTITQANMTFFKVNVYRNEDETDFFEKMK